MHHKAVREGIHPGQCQLLPGIVFPLTQEHTIYNGLLRVYCIHAAVDGPIITLSHQLLQVGQLILTHCEFLREVREALDEGPIGSHGIIIPQDSGQPPIAFVIYKARHGRVHPNRGLEDETAGGVGSEGAPVYLTDDKLFIVLKIGAFGQYHLLHTPQVNPCPWVNTECPDLLALGWVIGLVIGTGPLNVHKDNCPTIKFGVGQGLLELFRAVKFIECLF